MESLSIFLNLIYSTKIQGVGVDKLCWRPSTQKHFEVRCYYKVLATFRVESFPWKSIWMPKISTKVDFFFWVGSLRNILTMKNRRKCNIILVSWCYMCKRDEETIDHFLLHCPIARELWDMVFSLFEIQEGDV